MYVSNVGLVNMLVVQNEQLCDVIYMTEFGFLWDVVAYKSHMRSR